MNVGLARRSSLIRGSFSTVAFGRPGTTAPDALPSVPAPRRRTAAAASRPPPARALDPRRSLRHKGARRHTGGSDERLPPEILHLVERPDLRNPALHLALRQARRRGCPGQRLLPERR